MEACEEVKNNISMRFAPADSKKRRYSSLKSRSKSNKGSKKRKTEQLCDAQQIQTANLTASQCAASKDAILAKQEKTLDQLYKNHPDFFNNLNSKEAKDQTQAHIKKELFGNKLRNFAKLGSTQGDPRLKLLIGQMYYGDGLKDRNLFQGKKVLDIGCYSGHVAFEIAAMHNPKLVVGCDIDYKLVKAAIENIHQSINDDQVSLFLKKHLTPEEDSKMLLSEELEKEQKLQSLLKKVQSLPKSCQQAITGELQFLNSQRKSKASLISHDSLKSTIYGKLSYRHQNYIEQLKVNEKFDVILCFSVVKWIHLNYGDVGVKALFLKVYNQLEKNGFFIFEPQPWKSYKKQKHNSEVFKMNMESIELKPHLFKDYLKEIGFTLVQTIEDKDGRVEKPLFLYQK